MEIPTLQFCDHLFHGYQNHGKREREVGDKAETSQGWLRIYFSVSIRVSVVGLNQSLQTLTH